MVEAQHLVSTLKLVDTLAEQELLETLLEEAKPPLPPDCADLSYLLSTPFRYDAPYPAGSRFRRAGRTAGVFYASENVQTAVAEIAYWRASFFADSPDTPYPQNALEFTAFAASLSTQAALDLTQAPLDRDGAAWTHTFAYAACQDFADAAREAGANVLRYESVRDPERRANVAVLACSAFASREPVARQTWRLRFNAQGVQALCEWPDERWEMAFAIAGTR